MTVSKKGTCVACYVCVDGDDGVWLAFEGKRGEERTYVRSGKIYLLDELDAAVELLTEAHDVHRVERVDHRYAPSVEAGGTCMSAYVLIKRRKYIFREKK